MPKLFSIIKKYKLISSLSIFLALNSLLLLISKSSSQLYFINGNNVEWLYLAFCIIFISLLGSILFFSEKWKLKNLLRVFLWAYLPTEIILSLGSGGVQKFNIAIYAGIGSYLILAGGYFLSVYKNPWKAPGVSSPAIVGFLRDWFMRQGRMTISMIILVMIINFGFGIYNIEKFSAVDEPLWLYGRIESYWNGITQRVWAETLVSDKPGITVSIISGIGLLKENPQNYKPISWEGRFFPSSNDTGKLNFALRAPLFAFTVLMLPLFYFFLERLLKKKTALLAFSFIGLSPILIGMSRIINPDSILWVFAPLSILAYFTYLKRRDRRYLYASGILLGLALLTKYVANILFIFFIVLTFLEYILNTKRYATIKPFEYIRYSLIDYAMLSAISIAVFFFFCPAAWINPRIILSATILSQAFRPVAPIFLAVLGVIALDIALLRGIFMNALLPFLSTQRKNIFFAILAVFAGSILFAIANTYLGMKFINFEEILASPKHSHPSWPESFGIFFANFYPLVFSISPLALISIIVGIILFFTKKSLREREDVLLSVSIIALIVLYYVGSAVTHVASIIRYQIIVFPLVLVFSGITLNLAIESIFKNRSSREFLVASLVIAMLAFSLSVPFYISYASDLLPKQYATDLKDMGAGSYEAAVFLNTTLPDPENTAIWTDKAGVCVFFKGQCYTGFSKDILKNANIAYVVVSSGRYSRTSQMARGNKNDPLYFPKYYDMKNQWPAGSAVLDLRINNRHSQFVKIIKIQ